MRAPFKAVFEVCRLSELLVLAAGKTVQPEEEKEIVKEMKVELKDEVVVEKKIEVKPEPQDEPVDDGAGTGGVGGLFSITIADEEEMKVYGQINENLFTDNKASTS